MKTRTIHDKITFGTIRRSACLLFAVGLAAGCSHDPAENEATRSGDGGADGATAVTLDLNIPMPTAAGPETRALTVTEEQTVKEVDILAFRIDGTVETFDYWVTGKIVAGQGTATQTYSTSLNATAYKQRIVVVTNAHEQVANLMRNNWTGQPKATVLSRLEYRMDITKKDRWDATSPAQYMALPMWGESAPETITSTTKKLSAEIPLLRMLARIDVQVDGTVAGLRAQFKLKSVDLYMTNTGGNVVPAEGNYTDDSSSGKRVVTATKPTIPTSLQGSSSRRVGPIHYTDFNAPGTVDAEMVGAIYTFEAQNSTTDDSEATSLVIGGVYGADTQTTYYRVDITGTDKKKLDILRNHRYLVNIVKVSGSGHATVAEAWASKAVNIDVNILAWHDSGMPNVKYNGSYYLSSDKGTLNLFKNGYGGASTTKENVVAIQTNFPDGWKLDRVTEADGVTGSNWLLGLNPASGPANTSTSSYVTALANNTGADRTGLVWVKAGSIDFSIKVVQSGAKGMPVVLTPVDASGKEVTELVFAAPVGTAPAAQTLTINWTPIDRSVTVVGAKPANSTNEFAAGSGQPANAETIVAGSGTKTFTIAPPAITQSEYDANQFMEKATKYDFTVTDGVTTVTKSVTIRQAIFNITVNTAAYYTVNGTGYTFKVRSNAKWVIKSIKENPDQTYQDYAKTSMLANTSTDNFYANTTGGPNPAPAGGGDDVKFTTTGQIGKWGTIDVVFGSTDTPAKFPDQTVRLIMVAPAIKIVGSSFGNNNTNGALYSATTKAQRKAGDPADMYTNAVNFGPFDRSTVKCEPINIVDGGIANQTGDNSNVTFTTQNVTDMMVNDPDIVCIAGAVQWGDDVSAALKIKILDKGKTLFVATQDQPTLKSMIKVIFGQPWMDTSSPKVWFESSNPYQNVTGPTYQINDYYHPTKAGPFADVRLKNWGAQWDGTSGIYSIPPDVAVWYSNLNNTTGPVSPAQQGNPGDECTMFFLKQMNLMWICDDGFFRNDNSTATTTSPFYIDPNTKKPAPKKYGNQSQVDIYNSALFANILAWTIARYPKK